MSVIFSRIARSIKASYRRTTAVLKKNKQTDSVRNSARYIHSELKKGPVVAIGNHAIIFTLDATAKIYGTQDFNKLVLIKPPHFLDYATHLYPFYWGQRLCSNPPLIIESFLEQYPNHKLDQFITCGQMSTFRNSIVEKLVKRGMTVIHGNPKPIELLPHGRFQVEVLNPLHNHILQYGKNTKFVNWYSQPVPHDFPKVPSIPHTYLYKKPFESINDDLIIVGDGISTGWLIDHFAMNIAKNPNLFNKKPTIYYITKKPFSTELPKSITTSTANRDLVNVVRIEDTELEDKKKCVEILDSVTDDYVKVKIKLKDKFITGLLYTATGSQNTRLLTKNVPTHNKLEKPDINDYLRDNHYIETRENPFGSQLSSQQLWHSLFYEDNCFFPIGAFYANLSLKPSYLKALSDFSDIHTVPKSFYEVLAIEMLNNNVKLNAEFFTILTKHLGHNPVFENKPTRTLDTKSMVSLLCKCYKLSNSSDSDMAKFRQVLLNMIDKTAKNLKIDDRTKLGINDLSTDPVV